MSAFYEFDEVDTFTVGTVGRPGARVFYLQVKADGQRLAIKCEKQQAAAIARYLERVLSDLPPVEGRPLTGAMEAHGLDDAEPVFVLGPVGLGYDRAQDRVLVQLEEVGEVDEEGEPIDDDRGHVRVYLRRDQASAFARHATRIIEAGRPDCTWCGLPIDPDGHLCPRMN